MLEEQSRRLLRPGIATIDEAMQEVWAVFNSSDPLVISQPLVLMPNGTNVPPLTIVTQPNPDGTPPTPIQQIVQGPPLPPAPPFPGVVIPGVPPYQGLPEVTIDTNGIPRPTDGPTTPPPPIVPPATVPIAGGGGGTVINVTSGNMFAAHVLSHVSGNVWLCDMYFDNPAAPTSTLNCVAKGMDPAATGLAGSWCAGMVVGTGGGAQNWIFPALFLEDS